MKTSYLSVHRVDKNANIPLDPKEITDLRFQMIKIATMAYPLQTTDRHIRTIKITNLTPDF